MWWRLDVRGRKRRVSVTKCMSNAQKAGSKEREQAGVNPRIGSTHTHKKSNFNEFNEKHKEHEEQEKYRRYRADGGKQRSRTGKSKDADLNTHLNRN